MHLILTIFKDGVVMQDIVEMLLQAAVVSVVMAFTKQLGILDVQLVQQIVRQMELQLLLISLLSSGGDGRGSGSTLFAAAEWDGFWYPQLATVVCTLLCDLPVLDLP